MSKVITGKVRLSYVNVFQPRAIEEGQTPKYSVSVIIPKSDKRTISAIRKAISEALESGKAKFGGKIPKNYKNPLRDGDIEREEDEAYENCYFVNANSLRAPGVVDAELQPIIDATELYSGCYGRVSISFYPFNAAGNKGVAAGLNNVQKLSDGEALGGVAPSAEEDFGDDLA
tara:strand:- start:396 stop:914 length:519 start_codon:yes stop_codon:yes gene_type:complete